MKKFILLLPLLCLSITAPLVAAEIAQIELARKVIKATQFDRLFDQMGAQMQQAAAQAIDVSNPSQTPAQREAALKVMNEVSKISMDAAKGIMGKVDVIYAEVYSAAELNAMLAFFDSPEGKSMLDKQPQVMQRMMPLIQEMQQDIAPKIRDLVQKAKAEAADAAASAPPSPPAN